MAGMLCTADVSASSTSTGYGSGLPICEPGGGGTAMRLAGAGGVAGGATGFADTDSGAVSAWIAADCDKETSTGFAATDSPTARFSAAGDSEAAGSGDA